VRFAVVDGQRKQRYDVAAQLTFSPDGCHYVYTAARGEEAFTVVDERPASHRYQAIWTVSEARLPFQNRTTFHYLAVKDGDIFLVEEDVDR
jgi:hypothetical protein